MADSYSYALLVELEENKVPRLKNKLVKYFQSKKSNGGDCEVDYENGSRTAMLRFRQEEDQQNVLSKKGHQIRLDQGVLRITVRLLPDKLPKQEAPSDEVAKKPDVAEKKPRDTEEAKPAAEVQTEVKGEDDETQDEELCSALAIIENIPNQMSQEYLEMVIEGVFKDYDPPPTSESFTLQVIPSISSAVVTFLSGKENSYFVTSCPHNKRFTKMGLAARPLEVTKQALVDDVKSCSEAVLSLYFNREGEDVENVEFKEVEQSAIITFKDQKAAQKVLKKKTHHIRQKEIKVYPFYKSLGIALYGTDTPSIKLPAAISEPIDEALWRYLSDHQSEVETIRNQLKDHFCELSLNQSTICLSPVPSLLQEKDAKTIFKEWRDTVKSAIAQALLKFRSLKLQPEPTKWEESVTNIKQTLLNEDVAVVPDEASGVLTVVGLVADINRLEQTLNEVINRIIQWAQRETLSVTQKIKVAPSIFHILCQDGLQDKLLRAHPKLKMSYKKESAEFIVTGFNDEILTASKVICEGTVALKRQHLEVDKFVLDFLKHDEPEKLTYALLTSNEMNASFEIAAKKVHLLAVSDRDLTEAEDHLRKLLVSKYIDVEDSNVLKKQEWKDLVSKSENTRNKPLRTIQICADGQRVVVSGHSDGVEQVSSELEKFLTQNAEVEETVSVKPNEKVQYIKKVGTSWLGKVGDRVVLSYKKEAICVSGCRVHVTECKTLLKNYVSSLVFEHFKVSTPGMKTFFQEKEAKYLTSIWNETSCLAQLADETSDGQDDLRQYPKPVYQLQTLDGMEITVCKADMCSYPVDAVVNASNQNLTLNGGLAGALLVAAGPQLQHECDKLIKLKGQLKPGDSVITGAGGQLSCKKVIHAVGPVYDSANLPRVLAQLKKSFKASLELAEKSGCISVALPAISKNQGFPLNTCADTIIKAVKEYCDEKYGDNTLKKIHLVNSDDSAVGAMELAVKKVFGSSGVIQSPKAPSTTSPVPLKPLPLDPNCIGQVQTKEGLHITLMKGNIENATTEVIVNTVSTDLDLSKGAVSNSIFRMAGQTLQQLVQAENQIEEVGEVIVTAGCNLKSKLVYHAVAPQWNKGRDTSETTLKDIFSDCLAKAENSGIASISFPALGSGDLGFPKDLVASLLLKEIVEFSSKRKPQHLKKVVIILFPADTNTIQVFTDEFKKQFPSASVTVTAVPTSSPQSSGPFSKVVSGSGIHETKMGSVAVQVVTGDITKETSDIIVNSSNNSFSLKTGVSKAIMEAAGQAVEAECNTLGAQPNTGMILTQPGNIQCKKILHLVAGSDPVQINTVVKNALLLSAKHMYTSVSIPTIGTGQGNVSAKQVADAMLDAVIDVLSLNTPTTLKTIRIVIFQPHMLTDFFSSMQEREAKAAATQPPKDKGWFWAGIGSKIKNLWWSEKPQKGDFVIEPLTVDPLCFNICSESQASVDSAKKWISDLISEKYTNNTFSDSAILNFSDEDHQQLVHIQKTAEVSIRIESKNGQASITIEGLSKNVLEASNMINEMVRNTRDEEDLQNKVTIAKSVADWQYQQPGFQFQSFDPKNNFKLEEALNKKLQSVKVTVQGEDYTVKMPRGPGTDSQGRIVEIKRIDKLKDEDIPDSWDTMPANQTCLVVTIQPGTAEHTEVLKLFQASCQLAVIQIQRIQNIVLWKSLLIKKHDMEQRNGHQNNEKQLFHGTSEDTVDQINEHGFNRSFAGKNDVDCGKGTYFAVKASHSSSDTYSKPNQNQEKFMYLCRVLTGEFTLGQQDMIQPPPKGSASVQKYDSVVDDMGTPKVYVIFHDSHAYPEYLIKFK
ncbi:protein mono-ADP-ribosyltransferase PARP14-like isoform X1 [Notolabrus celidotus]|uniref:protein mono-ADP-ribosyltransferase PARP14-like isoform X1 n=1 Tax=Notolabrus celidotus TaxID=1203425 RepID=UPI00148FADC0|nr:protein mono-ADP-ribosyltransferase PARP14-like isoform X1 [Notolabrus celidotus]